MVQVAVTKTSVSSSDHPSNYRAILIPHLKAIFELTCGRKSRPVGEVKFPPEPD
jgi:hypothetical protein